MQKHHCKITESSCQQHRTITYIWRKEKKKIVCSTLLHMVEGVNRPQYAGIFSRSSTVICRTKVGKERKEVGGVVLWNLH